MQTATSETEIKSRFLSICVHHYTLRAPCPKGQGIFGRWAVQSNASTSGTDKVVLSKSEWTCLTRTECTPSGATTKLVVAPELRSAEGVPRGPRLAVRGLPKGGSCVVRSDARAASFLVVLCRTNQ